MSGKLVTMIFRNLDLLFVLLSLLWYWRINASEDGSGINDEIITSEDPIIWNVSVSTQSQLDQFMENVTAHNDRRNTSYLHLSLAGENSYTLDIVKLMNISLTTDGSLILESKGRLADIDCTSSHSDLKELKEVVQAISRASLVLMDGLVFTGCPVPIMIEEAYNVTIQNCVFKHHEHGAVSIYESQQIIIRNCKFYNNTSDGYFTKKSYIGSSGGLSIGYNYSDDYNYFTSGRFQYFIPPPPTVLHILIINCVFTNNSALLLNGQGNSLSAIQNNTFYGRGGALSLLISVRHTLEFVFNDNKVINNFAYAVGGGMYCLFQTRSNQIYKFDDNVFMNNTASIAGGIAFIYLYIPIESRLANISNVLNNCNFYNNTARSKVAGAVSIYSVLGLSRNVFITFNHCKFYNNTAVTYGGAVDITSYDFFVNIQVVPLVEFNNCAFDGNVANDGAAMNIIRYGAQLYNVTFKNNRQSAVRIIGCVVHLHGEVNFIDNKAQNGGALYIITFGQLKIFPDTTVVFEGNEGTIGASIVVLTRFSQSPIFNQPLYNPQCFLLHQYLHNPFSDISNLNLTFRNNDALAAAAIFTHTAQQCTWTGYSSPYFDPHSLLNWDFLHTDGQHMTQIQTSITQINSCNRHMGKRMPGELFSLTMEMIDELNQSASGFMELYVSSNQSETKYKIYPAVVFHHSHTPLNVTIVVESNDTNSYDSDVTIIVREFMGINRSIGCNFTVRVIQCSGEYELTYNATLNGRACQYYSGNSDVGTCDEDHSILILTDGQWGLNQHYAEQPDNLTVYPCPPGYCRCFHNLCSVGNETCSYAYFNSDPDKQCDCNRRGYLCGDCRDGKGVSALLNHCVDCSNINAISLAALCIIDATLIIIMLCKDVRFPALLFPAIFFINMVSYVGKNYPTSYDQVGKYMYFINSLLSLYFPYDFCLYSGATPLAMYAFRYFPSFLTIIICSVGLKLHQCIFKKTRKFSWNNLWLLLTLQYSHVVYTSVTILHCPQVLNENGEHEFRWFVYGTLECFTGYHIPLGLCAFFVLVMCLLIVPLLGLVATGKLMRPYWLGQLTKHLKHSFKENLPWWCMIELGRKLVFLLLLIPFPQNTGPPMLVLMTTLAVYAYVLPYKDMLVNIVELLFQLSLLLFLMVRSTSNIAENYLQFPNRQYDDNMGTKNCSSETGTAYLTWVLFPFAYLPLVVIIGIFTVKMLLRLWQCVCYKYVKDLRDHSWQGKLTTSYHVNASRAKYFLLGFKDDSINFVDAATADDS